METNQSYQSLGPGFEPENQKKSRSIPVWIFVFLLITLAAVVVSMLRFPKVFSEYKVYRLAEERMEAGETSAALEDLMEVVERHPNSVPMIVKLIDLSMENGYYDSAAYIFNEYLVGKDLSDSQYYRMLDYSERLDTYYNTYDALDSLFMELNETLGDTPDEEAAERYMEELRNSLKDLLEDPSQDQTFILYYLSMYAETRKDSYSYIKQAYDREPEFFDVRVQLGNMARGLGNLDEAEMYLNEALAKDKEDSGALRGLAIVAMLRGDLEKGLDLAKQAYDLYADGTYVRDTYLVALHVNGCSEEEAAMITEIEELQGGLEDDTKELLADACTLQDYYMGE